MRWNPETASWEPEVAGVSWAPPAPALAPRPLPLAEQLDLFGVEDQQLPAPTGPGADAIPEPVPAYVEEGPSCARSPCSGPVWDPKASVEEIEAARLLVGTPKLRRAILRIDMEDTGKLIRSGPKAGQPKLRMLPPVWESLENYNRPGRPEWPLAVSYGVGIDSTAVLVGLVQLYRETRDRRFVPMAITFADTGGEKRSTYAYLSVFNPWLVANGFPPVTVVAWAQQFDPAKSWGSHRTLEQKCLNNHTLPSITMSGFKKSECSITWKHDPQDHWFRHYSGLYVTRHGHNTRSAILARLAQIGGAYPAAELAENMHRALGVTKATVGVSIGGLIDDGYVDLLSSGRGRVVAVSQRGSAAAASSALMDHDQVLPDGLKIVKAIGYDATETERLDPNAKGSTFRAGSGGEEETHDYMYWYPLMEWGWDRARCYAEIEREVGLVPPKSSCTYCGAMKPEEIRALTKQELRDAIFMEQVALRGRHATTTVKGLAFAWSWTDFALGVETKGMPQRAVEQIEQFGRLVEPAEVAEIMSLADAWIAASPAEKGSFDVSPVGHAMGLSAFVNVRGLRGGVVSGWDVFEDRRRNPPVPHDPLLEGSILT